MEQDQILLTYVQSHSRAREWTENLLHRIRAVRAARGSKRVDEINKLELEVMGRLYEAEHDTQLTEQVQLVFSDWLNQLVAHYPELNTSELHLCCFLKMGLSTKQIAVLQGIQINSVKEAQKRISQKLNLQDNTDLTTFLKSY